MCYQLTRLHVIFAIAAAVSLLPVTASGQTLDYHPHHPLEGINGVERGYLQHHLDANEYGLEKFRERLHSGKIPRGSTVSFDWEPWLKHKNQHPWYGVGTDAENLECFGKYAWFIREVAPDLKQREVTLAVYAMPVLMQRNWARAWREKDSREYREWHGNQVRVIAQAEQSGFLPALRSVGGHVDVVGYMPTSWYERKWTRRALRRTIDNVDEVLDQHDVPHRWLWTMGTTGKAMPDDLMRICIEKTHGRSAWWGDLNWETRERTTKGVDELVKIYKDF